jgi:hypothetical protein
LVCIGCEACECEKAKATKIGVAVLGMQDLWEIEPSRLPELVLGFNKSAHYRPIEFSKLVNRRFVHGCPGPFGFGTKTCVRTADGAAISYLS